jgi:N-succinyldiaminopimelate aminotransferase
MPRPPDIAQAAAAISEGSVFTPLARKLAEHEGPLFPLHVGDTWLDPFDGGRMEDLHVSDHPGLHCYSDPRGRKEVIETVVEKVRARNRIPCDPESVVLTAGATGAIASALAAILDPGEEVALLAPFWPLIRGVVRAARGSLCEIPFNDCVHSVADARKAILEKITPRTVVLYVSTPNNPTGHVIPEDQLQAIAELARERELWIISDEVYEDYVYRGEHVPMARFAPERTLTAFSFSKAYGMAGNRTGYLVGPRDVIQHALKFSTNTIYSAPTAGQLAGARALRDGGRWLEDARRAYQSIGDEVASTLGIDPPEGSTFLFFDVSRFLDERAIWGLLEDCLDDGVVLAPGFSSGEAYETWVRLCYTSIPPPQVREAVGRLAGRLKA